MLEGLGPIARRRSVQTHYSEGDWSTASCSIDSA
jgi:hypothetical protein